jgi:hypothetical protein
MFDVEQVANALHIALHLFIRRGDHERGRRTSPRGTPDVEFVADPSDDPGNWSVKERGGGAMILEPKVFGRLFMSDTANYEDLEFVSRSGVSTERLAVPGLRWATRLARGQRPSRSNSRLPRVPFLCKNLADGLQRVHVLSHRKHFGMNVRGINAKGVSMTGHSLNIKTPSIILALGPKIVDQGY